MEVYSAEPAWLWIFPECVTIEKGLIAVKAYSTHRKKSAFLSNIAIVTIFALDL